MRSYALFLALAVLHARAATIPVSETEKKLPIGNEALDDVSLDNDESEQQLIEPADTVRDTENNLHNTIPENIPVKIIEGQPIIKKITLNENSNDYVPDNDDSSNIKRVEIDLKNPGPPQRQEHDSQNPVTYYSYIDKERAVAAIKQSIAESQNIFTRGIQDVTQKFQYYFTHNDELSEVSKNIQNLRKSFDTEVIKLGNTINSYLKPELEGAEKIKIPSGIKEVENRLESLEKNFNYGVGILSEGVELLSILKEEDEQNLKISGKAGNENVPAQTGTTTETAPVKPGAGSNTNNPTASNPVFEYLQNLNNSIFNAFNNLGSTIQNFLNPNQNQNQNPSTNSSTTSSQGGFNPANFFQGINIPNVFQQQPNQNQQQQQGTTLAGTQSDDAGSSERPNILQQIQTTFQNIVNPGQKPQQQTQPNPVTQFLSGVNQGISNLFQPKPGAQQTIQQTNKPNTTSTQPAVADPVAAQGTNSVPVAPAQVVPSKPGKEHEALQSAPVQNVPVQSIQPQSGPIQQIVQNKPVVKKIANSAQRIQGLPNSSKPRDTVVQNSGSKGSGGTTTGNFISGLDDIKTAPVNKQPETIPEMQDDREPAAEVNKTE